MGMNILKSAYWNYRNKLYYLAKETLYNLYYTQCESSDTIFLYFNVKIEVNHILKSIMDDDCYIVDDVNSNNTISTTAPETGATSSGGNSCGSSNLSDVGTSRRRAQRNKESTSNTNNPNLVVNPFNISQLLNYQSLFQYHVPSLYNEHPNYTMQRFRNASLFSEENAQPSNTSPQQNSSTDYFKWKNVTDEEIAKNLRRWSTVNGNLGSTPGLQFTLMSYNVLAQDLLVEHQYLYRKHKPRALLWENRWRNLYREILEYDPDIICLQEVQENHLPEYFSQILEKGYAYLFKKKTGMRTDGCAIYYKQSVFKLLEHTTVEYNQHFPTLDRDNIAIIAKFAPFDNITSEFIVATTHLLYNPKREDVRLSQTQLLLAEVDRIAYKGEKKEQYTPVIITGDFNTEPNSAVYRLLVDGTLKYDTLSNRTLKETNSTQGLEGKYLIPSTLRVTDNCQHLDLLEKRVKSAKLTREEELKLIHIRHNKRDTPEGINPEDDELFSTGVLSHNLNLQSVFLHRINRDTEGTTYQDAWITVDYIFYSGASSKGKKNKEDKLKLVSRYSIPTTKDLSSKVRHIPNFAFGSDHLSLLAKFKLVY